MVIESNFYFAHRNMGRSNIFRESNEKETLLPTTANSTPASSSSALHNDYNYLFWHDEENRNCTHFTRARDLLRRSCHVYGFTLLLAVVLAVLLWTFPQGNGTTVVYPSDNDTLQDQVNEIHHRDKYRDDDDYFKDKLEWWQTSENVPVKNVLVSDINALSNTTTTLTYNQHPNRPKPSSSSSSSPSSLRWGILGLGRIAHDFTTMLRMAGANVTAVAAGSLPHAQARATEFAKLYGVPRAHGSYQAMAEDPDVDIVYVATTNQLHHNNTILLLQAGKNVVVEKPMAVTLQESQAMVAAARQHQRFLLTNYWTRFFPVVRHYTKSTLHSGRMGALDAMHGDFAFTAHPMSTTSDRLLQRSLGGGTMLDLGCYLVCLAVFAASTQNVTSLLPADIQATAQTTIGSTQYEVDTEVSFSLQWKNPVKVENESNTASSPFSMIFSGQVSFRRPSSFEVEVGGSHGRLILHNPANAATRATLYDYKPYSALQAIERVQESPLMTFDNSYYPEQYPGAAGFVHVIRAIEACMAEKGIPGRAGVEHGCTQLDELAFDEQLTIAEIIDKIMQKIGYWAM